MKRLLRALFLGALLFPMLAYSQPIQKVMGHYESDVISGQGYSMSSSGSLSLAIMMDAEQLEMYQGGNIVAIRVGLVEPAEITRVFIIPVQSDGKYGAMTYWPVDSCGAGWNVVQLDTPYKINVAEDEKLLIGFYYKQVSGAKPLSFVDEGPHYDTYTYKKVGSVSKWRETDFINYGNLSLQCIVAKDSFPEYSISSYDLQCDRFVVAGEDLHFSLNVINHGIKGIAAGELDMDVFVDGEKVATVTNNVPLENGYRNLIATVPTTGFKSGTHILTVQPVKANDQEIDAPVSNEAEFFIYQQGFPRQKHLVEQLTSTYCMYCPLGNSVLSKLTSMRDDVIWVGIHGNLGSGVDPFRSNQGDSLLVYLTGGSVSYPSGVYDRSTGWEDDVNIANSLGYYEAYHTIVAEYLGNFFDYITELMPTLAEINADCSFNESTRMATVSVQGRVSRDFNGMMGEDARLTVYLVEDSLVARQLNGDTWVSNYIHNGVFRKALGEGIMGQPLNRYNGRYKNDYRFSVPDNWKWENLRVVAFISRPIGNYVNGFTDMYVNNAEVFTFHVSDAVEEIATDVNAVPIEYYDIMGHRHDSLQQGINIVKMSDGTSKKVLVR